MHDAGEASPPAGLEAGGEFAAKSSIDLLNLLVIQVPKREFSKWFGLGTMDKQRILRPLRSSSLHDGNLLFEVML